MWSQVGFLLFSVVGWLEQPLDPLSSGLLCGVTLLSGRSKSAPKVSSEGTLDLHMTGHISFPVYVCGLWNS